MDSFNWRSFQGDANAELTGADAAERDASDATGSDGEHEEVSDTEIMESGDEEEETALLGGGGFTEEQLAAAEAAFKRDTVCSHLDAEFV